MLEVYVRFDEMVGWETIVLLSFLSDDYVYSKYLNDNMINRAKKIRIKKKYNLMSLGGATHTNIKLFTLYDILNININYF